MRPDPVLNPSRWLRRVGRDLHGITLEIAFYIGVLTLLVIGAVTMWNGLPDAVAQAHDVAVTAGWVKNPPPLRGSL